uniref:DUF3039 domain-containing protein n=1 Tax=Panagrellus redivivus TaxID=6233 RepID=A0A7E4WBZ6_PANRE
MQEADEERALALGYEFGSIRRKPLSRAPGKEGLCPACHQGKRETLGLMWDRSFLDGDGAHGRGEAGEDSPVDGRSVHSRQRGNEQCGA